MENITCFKSFLGNHNTICLCIFSYGPIYLWKTTHFSNHCGEPSYDFAMYIPLCPPYIYGEQYICQVILGSRNMIFICIFSYGPHISMENNTFFKSFWGAITRFFCVYSHMTPIYLWKTIHVSSHSGEP